MNDWAPGPALAAHHAGVMVIRELAPCGAAVGGAGNGAGLRSRAAGGWQALLRASGRLPY